MNRRYGKIMLGLFLLFIGFNSITNGNLIGVLMGLGGFYLLARQFEESRNNRRQESENDREYDRWRTANRNQHTEFDFEHVSDKVDQRPTANADRVWSHALEAVQAAGLDASSTPVLPVDIGVFAHKGDEKPNLYRTNSIPQDIDYIQPFVQLRLPTRAKGKITFELLDDKGETLFRRTEEHDLKRGRNLVVPAARLPVHDGLNIDDDKWMLRIKADGMVLAEHTFKWQEETNNFVAENLAEDGEISQELRAAMAESRLEQMSLDELLTFQEEPAKKQSYRR